MEVNDEQCISLLPHQNQDLRHCERPTTRMIKVAVVAPVETSISAVERPVAVEPEVPLAKETFAKMFDRQVSHRECVICLRFHKQLIGCQLQKLHRKVCIDAYIIGPRPIVFENSLLRSAVNIFNAHQTPKGWYCTIVCRTNNVNNPRSQWNLLASLEDGIGVVRCDLVLSHTSSVCTCTC